MLERYETLLKQYGPQRWWPTTPKNRLIPEYRGGPSDEREMFEVMIGAILTQNTSWKNVEKALINLNKENLIYIKKIKTIDIEKLKQLIRPAGYYNQKAERIKLLAEFLTTTTVKELNKLSTEELRTLLLQQKGIGPETADSIILYAFNRPIFVIDTYTKRMFKDCLDEKTSYDEWQALFHKNLKNDIKLFQEFHALIVTASKNR